MILNSGKPALRAEIDEMQEYFPGTEGFPIRLDSNEMPYDFPLGLKEQVAWEIMRLPLNRYPQNLYRQVREALAGYVTEQCPSETGGVAAGAFTAGNIVLSDGLDEMIQIISLAFAGGGSRRAILPVPGFSQYKTGLTIAGAEVHEVPLQEGFRLDVDAIVGLAVPSGDASAIFICNPNNPTGNLFDPLDVRRIIEETGAAVVIDEAYAEFAGQTALPLLSEFPSRVIILRTFSKAFGLAGVRLGYAICGKEIAGYVNKVRQPFNVGSVPLAIAKVALRSRSYVKRHVAAVRAERSRLFELMASIPGVEPYPSETNFILFAVNSAGVEDDEVARKVWEGLRTKGVAIRKFSGGPMISGCLRVTVGSPWENDAFVAALRESMEGIADRTEGRTK